MRNVKPSAEHLEAVLNGLEVDGGEAMVVGDGISDMKCATEAGVIAVGFPTGFSSQKDLINSGANYIITSITDLPALIDQIEEIPER